MCTMPLAKKAAIALVPGRNVRKELEILYARRSAVNAVIESLEGYQQLRRTQPVEGRRKTA